MAQESDFLLVPAVHNCKLNLILMVEVQQLAFQLQSGFWSYVYKRFVSPVDFHLYKASFNQQSSSLKSWWWQHGPVVLRKSFLQASTCLSISMQLSQLCDSKTCWQCKHNNRWKNNTKKSGIYFFLCATCKDNSGCVTIDRCVTGSKEKYLGGMKGISWNTGHK